MGGGGKAVGGCCGQRIRSNNYGEGGAAASCQKRAEIRVGREGIESCFKLPKSGRGEGRGVAVAMFGELP